MADEQGTLVWRVRAADDSTHASAFDALIFGTDTVGPVRQAYDARLLAEAVPYESKIADIPLVLVVRARPEVGPLIVDCDVIDRDGNRRAYGRSTQPLAVIVRSKGGMTVGGLPGALPEELATPT
jgi:hypothetical protein